MPFCLSDFRNGVEANGQERGKRAGAQTECVMHCPAALLCAGRVKGRKTDDVARGVNIFEVGLKMLVDRDDSSSADCYACLLELQLGGIALSARRNQQRIGGQDRPGGKLETHGPGFQRGIFGSSQGRMPLASGAPS